MSVFRANTTFTPLATGAVVHGAFGGFDPVLVVGKNGENCSRNPDLSDCVVERDLLSSVKWSERLSRVVPVVFAFLGLLVKVFTNMVGIRVVVPDGSRKGGANSSVVEHLSWRGQVSVNRCCTKGEESLLWVGSTVRRRLQRVFDLLDHGFSESI